MEKNRKLILHAKKIEITINNLQKEDFNSHTVKEIITNLDQIQEKNKNFLIERFIIFYNNKRIKIKIKLQKKLKTYNPLYFEKNNIPSSSFRSIESLSIIPDTKEFLEFPNFIATKLDFYSKETKYLLQHYNIEEDSNGFIVGSQKESIQINNFDLKEMIYNYANKNIKENKDETLILDKSLKHFGLIGKFFSFCIEKKIPTKIIFSMDIKKVEKTFEMYFKEIKKIENPAKVSHLGKVIENYEII